nr:MAG TPA: hypothetical protein [Caudoviricetes sp.]
MLQAPPRSFQSALPWNLVFPSVRPCGRTPESMQPFAEIAEQLNTIAKTHFDD